MNRKHKKAKVTPDTEGENVALYDAIMAEIEPDLTNERILLLPRLYAQESVKQRSARLKRYERALPLFDAAVEALDAFCDDMYGRIRYEGHQSLAAREKRECVREEQTLGHFFDDLPSAA